MTSLPPLPIVLLLLLLLTPIHSFSSTTPTLAVINGGPTPAVCAIPADQQTHSILCSLNNTTLPLSPNISFSFIAGGHNTLCGIRSGGSTLICWNATFIPKRLYYNQSLPLHSLDIGDTRICSVVNDTGDVKCWRNGVVSGQFLQISSGPGFSCGVLRSTNKVTCWGGGDGNNIESEFTDIILTSIVVGGNFACGFNITGNLLCRGGNESGQLNVPLGFKFSGVTLGMRHGCGISRQNGYVVCWGGEGGVSYGNVTDGVAFEGVVAGLDFTCGLTTRDFSVVCWGRGWDNGIGLGVGVALPKILPGPCVDLDECGECGVYPQSDMLCSGTGVICRRCDGGSLNPPNAPPTGKSSRGTSKGMLAFAVVGSVGVVLGICSGVYCLWNGVCFGKKKVHNSVQPTITGVNSNGHHSNSSPVPSRSSTIKRQGSRAWSRQRSGTSGLFGRQRSGTSNVFGRQRSSASGKFAERAEEFLFSDLVVATNSFSVENKIGGGSFGIVYKGKLPDGREVAIKRGETGTKLKKFQEKESAFDSELSFLSRLHHKHLVRLVGYCEEGDERLLVYDYMKNGALHDHLHNKNNVVKESSLVNSWKMRIKIALDAARGIEYLHNYAVPPIIHRDIKSSNILLDANWTARVSDFGLSLNGPESDREYRPMKAAGTVGYIDPEYYGLNVLTEKSDVYGLGVVLLEILTGRRAIFRSGDDGNTPLSLVDFVVPAIMAGELTKILDMRVGLPELNEAEAVELVAYTAMHCVNLEGQERPSMTDIVANLDRAFFLCEDSHGSISSNPISIVSD